MSKKNFPSRTAWQNTASRIVLFGLLVQILLFFLGLMVPVRRAGSLWGKDLEERRAVVWGIGRAFTSIAEKFPADARIYLLYPDGMLHVNAVYYFYPRTISVTMTNARYNTGEEYASWNEVPTWQWLETNKYTFVLSFKNGARAWRVEPGLNLNANTK